jgi:hypothetical protein
MLGRLKHILPSTWRRALRSAWVGLSFEHVCGPKRVELDRNQAAVTCVVKDGSFFLEQFIDHYRTVGFRHVFFLDNGSSDDTLDRAARHRDVTVHRCTLPVGKYQPFLKRKLAQIAVPAGWCLDVDIDEFFDYPGSDTLPLPRFLDYLNEHAYTAVLTQMLDMFSDQPLVWLRQGRGERLKEVHRYYDITAVTKVRYEDDPFSRRYGDRNLVGTTDTTTHWGGIRKTIYGREHGLTKHSLFRTDARLDLFPHVHYVNGARLADVAATLLHYKFTSNAFEMSGRNRKAFTGTPDDYDAALETIRARPDLLIKGDSARELHSVNDLLDAGFLFASERYRKYVMFAAR